MVDTTDGETASGADYREMNPKGNVHTLEVECEVLTEGPAILQFLGDKAVKDGSANQCLAPTPGTMARGRVNEGLNFTGPEPHIAFGPFFNPNSTGAQKEAARQAVAGKLDWLEGRFADGRTHLTGEAFTTADAYAFVVTNCANLIGIALIRRRLINAVMAWITARPAVQHVLKAERLAA